AGTVTGAAASGPGLAAVPPSPASAVITATESGDIMMKKTLLAAVSAFAIFTAGGVALAQDQNQDEPQSDTMDVSPQDTGATEQNGSTDSGTGETGTDMDAGTGTD